MLRDIEALPGIKKVFVRSGIRFDYLLLDKDPTFFRQLVSHHVSGQLKVAPEHCSGAVLSAMGKPDISVYERFRKEYFRLSEEAGLEQYLVPYLMSSHPGSKMEDAIALALWLKKWGYAPEQVQDFYPTPGTISTTVYYTGIHPLSGKEVYVARDYKEKQMQRALLQYAKPENAHLVREALRYAKREDLIGNGPECLIRPARGEGNAPKKTQKTVKKPIIQRKGNASSSGRKTGSSFGGQHKKKGKSK